MRMALTAWLIVLATIALAMLMALTITPKLALGVDPSADPSASVEASPTDTPTPAPTPTPTAAPTATPVDTPAPTAPPSPTPSPTADPVVTALSTLTAQGDAIVFGIGILIIFAAVAAFGTLRR